MTTFKQPLRVGDKSENSVGMAVLAQVTTQSYAEASKVLARLPRPYQVIDIQVDILTAFNAATTNTLDLGVTGDLDRYADNLSLTAAGRVLATSDVSELSGLVDTTDDGGTTEIIGTYAQTGTAATAGLARITVLYTCTKTPDV